MLLLALPAPALACPTGDDLDAGILLTLEDGTTELYQTAPGNEVRVIATYEDGYQSANLLIHGVYVSQLGTLEDGKLDLGTVLQTVYDRYPDVPSENSTGSFDTRVGSIADGLYPEQQTFAWDTATKVKIGACTYDALPGTLTYKSDVIDVTETVTYISELGIGLLTTYAEVGFDTDVFTYVDIATP